MEFIMKWIMLENLNGLVVQPEIYDKETKYI